jgi:hypothetical protein
MTKAQRMALTASAQRASGLPVTADAAKSEKKAVETARANDLDNPETQRKIELPETIEIVLNLPEGKKAAVISTEFTHEQVYDWNLFEDLQSFSQLLGGELRSAQFAPGDHAAYTAATTTSRMRAAVRKILSKITVYKEPWTTEVGDREIRHERPTEDEIRRGIVLEATGEPNLFAMRQLADILFGMYAQEVERQKNVRAAAVKR